MKYIGNRAVFRATAAVVLTLSMANLASAGLTHRYSFSNGAELTDSVGGANLINGGAVTFGANRADLPGGGGGDQSFLQFPAGVLPTGAADSISIETWGAYADTTGTWSRIFDLGQGQADYIFLTPNGGNNSTRTVLKRNNGAEQGYFGPNNLRPLVSAGASVQHQTMVVFDNAADTIRFYIDGQLFNSTAGVTHTLENLGQDQNYIGKAQYNDPQLQGNVDEFRIYDSVLTSADVALNFLNGPDSIAAAGTFNFSVPAGNIAAGSSYSGTAPGALDRATIANGGTATSTGATLGQVQLTSGTVNVDSGTLSLAGGLDLNPGVGQTASVVINGGTLSTTGITSDVGTGTRSISLGGGGTLAFVNTVDSNTNVPITLAAGGGNISNGVNLGLRGVISGPGGFNKQGAGALFVSNVNTFAGDVDIQQGVIVLEGAAANTLGTGKVTVRTDAIFRNNGVRTITNNFELNGGIIDIGGAVTSTFNGNFAITNDGSILRADGGSRYIINGNITGTDAALVLGGGNQTSVINGTINLGEGGTIVRSGGGIWALANDSVVAGSVLIQTGSTLQVGNGGATGSIGNATVLFPDGGNGALAVSRSGNTALPNLVSGTGQLIQNGPGILTVTNAANDYSGGTQINGGVLLVPDFATLGTGNVTANVNGAIGVLPGVQMTTILTNPRFVASSTGAIALTENSSEALDFTTFPALRLGTAGDFTYSGVITPAGGVYRFGGGVGNLTVASNLNGGTSAVIGGAGTTVRLTGTNTYTGVTTVNNNGTLILNGTEELDASSGLTLNSGGTVRFVANATGTTDLTTKALTVSNGQIDTNGNNVTFAAANIAGTGGYLSKRGLGTLTLAGRNATVTNLFVREGELKLTGAAVVTASAFSSIGQLNGDNGTLTLQDTAKLTVNGDFNISDVAISTGTMNVSGGAGVLGPIVTVTTLFVGKNAGSMGTVNQSGGTVQGINAGGDWRIGGGGSAADVASVGIYNLSGGLLTTNRNFQIGSSGNGTLKITGGLANITGGFAAVARFGTGVGLLDMSTGNGTFTHTVNRLIVAEDGQATVNLGGSSTINVQGLQLGLAAIGTGTVNQTGGTMNILGNYGLTGGAGTSTYNLSGGLLDLKNFNVAADLDAFNFTGGELRNVTAFGKPLVQTGATSLLTVNGTQSMTIAGNYTLTDGEAKVGPGLTILANGGSITMTNGKLTGPGNVSGNAYNLNSGTVTAGLVGNSVLTKDTQGTLTLVGAFAWSPALVGTGGADIKNGKVVFDYTGQPSPATQIVNALDAGFDVAFASGQLRSSTAADNRGLGYIVDTAGSKVTVAATLYGDTDLDFAVTFDDLLSLAQNYSPGTPGRNWAQGDSNYDFIVDFDDLLKIAQNYNQSLSLSEIGAVGSDFAADYALALALTPEPTSLAALGLSSVMLRRRRK